MMGSEGGCWWREVGGEGEEVTGERMVEVYGLRNKDSGDGVEPEAEAGRSS